MEENVNVKSIPINEQETHISFMRDESFARIYTSDTTQMTRLDKLCENNPDMYKLVEDTGNGKNYICYDKTLASLRRKNESYQRNKSRLLKIGLQGIEIVTILNNLIYVYFTDTR